MEKLLRMFAEANFGRGSNYIPVTHGKTQEIRPLVLLVKQERKIWERPFKKYKYTTLGRLDKYMTTDSTTAFNSTLIAQIQDGMYATSQFAPRFLLALILLTRLIYSQSDPGLCLKTPGLLPTGLFINTASHGGLYAYRRSHVLRPSDRHIGIELVNIQIRTLAKAKRARAPGTLYPNSSLTFHPLIKLVHDVELNPGPQNFSVKESGGKNANSMKLAR